MSASRFAAVLDEKVITAPVIRRHDPGGSGYIEGNFTAESATELAILLRAGALPASIKVLEQRTVGPDLGADSIKSGTIASIVSAIAVLAFMALSYRIFGLFANIALILNIILMFAAALGHRRDADAARHRRHRADHRHGGRRQRADLRANTRGAAQARAASPRRSRPATARRSRRSWTPTSRR